MVKDGYASRGELEKDGVKDRESRGDCDAEKVIRDSRIESGRAWGHPESVSIQPGRAILLSHIGPWNVHVVDRKQTVDLQVSSGATPITNRPEAAINGRKQCFLQLCSTLSRQPHDPVALNLCLGPGHFFDPGSPRPRGGTEARVVGSLNKAMDSLEIDDRAAKGCHSLPLSQGDQLGVDTGMSWAA